MRDIPIATYVLNDSWNWNLMGQHVNLDTISLIANYPVPHPSKGKDFPSWSLTSNGPSEDQDFPLESSPWLAPCYEKRKKRHFSDNDSCDYCHDAIETDSLVSFFSLGLHDWLKANINGSIKTQESHWSMLFCMIAWQLWNAKNDRIFKYSPSVPQNIIHQSIDYARLSHPLNSSSKRILNRSSKSETLISWSLSTTDLLKLNIDSSVFSFPLEATCGEVIHDDQDSFVYGFVCKISTSSAIKAKLWSLLEGLKLIKARNLQCVVIEMDS
ncbi:uncharacterized protein LOC113850839 [Abrus precatorius]|uniref:Uncharacterized protein LOC113850839 n=1 Tax=Abrus precatorius TaxID=3816 RepID=A0A8B8K066_ABRPR|nr:uncharacterized protein LOC113850839 [Abrus precatorius]